MVKLLNGKTALVTGAASGIGKAVALAYGREGANVVLSDLSEEKGEEARKEVEALGVKAIFRKADVSVPEEVEALVKVAVDTFGSLDVACNNAGISGEMAVTKDYSIEGWHKIIAVNLDSVFYCTKYELAAMKSGSAIVNIASILGKVAAANSPGYVAAKHGVIGLTETAAIENGPAGIRVNSVGPGYIETPLLNALGDEERQGLVDLHPIGRLGKAEEVAELVLWLSSDRASFVTGAYYNVDGGYLAR